MDFMNFRNITPSPVSNQQHQQQQQQQQSLDQLPSQIHDKHLGQSYLDFFQSTSISKLTAGITENPTSTSTSNYTYNNKSSAESNSTISNVSPSALPGSTMSFIGEDSASIITTPLNPAVYDQKESQHGSVHFQNGNTVNAINNNNLGVGNSSHNSGNHIETTNGYPKSQNAAYGSSSSLGQPLMSHQADFIYNKQEHYPYNPTLQSSENDSTQSNVLHSFGDSQDVYYQDSSYPVPSCQDGFQPIYEQSQWLKQKFSEKGQSSFSSCKNSTLMDPNHNQTFLYSTAHQDNQQVNSVPFQIQLENFRPDQHIENDHQHEPQSQAKMYFDNQLIDNHDSWHDSNSNITSFQHSNVDNNDSFTDIAHFQAIAETSNNSLENNTYAYAGNENGSHRRHHQHQHQHQQVYEQQQPNLTHNENVKLGAKIGINSDGIGMNSGIDFKDPVISKLLKSRRRKKKNDYRCSHCSSLFPNILSFMEHMDEYKLIKFQSPPPPPPMEFDSTIKVGDDVLNVCNFHNCGKMFKRKDSLRRHARLVHENKNSRFNQRLRIQRIILEEQK